MDVVPRNLCCGIVYADSLKDFVKVFAEIFYRYFFPFSQNTGPEILSFVNLSTID
jgi:hypothetical protein